LSTTATNPAIALSCWSVARASFSVSSKYAAADSGGVRSASFAAIADAASTNSMVDAASKSIATVRISPC